jgi:hypothetical protein
MDLFGTTIAVTKDLGFCGIIRGKHECNPLLQQPVGIGDTKHIHVVCHARSPQETIWFCLLVFPSFGNRLLRKTSLAMGGDRLLMHLSGFFLISKTSG